MAKKKSAKQRKSLRNANQRKRGMWDFFTESSREAMRRGQLGMFGAMTLIGIILMRMPSEDLTVLTDKILQALNTLRGISYLCNVIFIISFVLYAKSFRRRASYEQRRIGKEKSDLQKKLAGHDLGSSD